MLFFTDKGQIYRVKVADFELCKPSSMGDYIPSKLSMDDDEHVIGCKMVYELNPEHHMIYVFENGKGLRVAFSSYITTSRRKKISGAFSTASLPVAAIYEAGQPKPIFIRSTAGKAMLIKSNLIPEKSTRTAAGVQIMQLPKKGVTVDLVTDRIEDVGQDATKCRKNAIPSTGTSIAQLTFNF